MKGTGAAEERWESEESVGRGGGDKEKGVKERDSRGKTRSVEVVYEAQLYSTVLNSGQLNN